MRKREKEGKVASYDIGLRCNSEGYSQASGPRHVQHRGPSVSIQHQPASARRQDPEPCTADHCLSRPPSCDEDCVGLFYKIGHR